MAVASPVATQAPVPQKLTWRNYSGYATGDAAFSRRHSVRREARAISGHRRGRRLPGDSLHRRVGDGVPLVPSQGSKPLFGFGFGLSYTTFDIADVSVNAPEVVNSPVSVTASVTNTGAVAGAEVVQVYLGLPVDGQPPKRLVGFQKVFVEPGESKPVTIIIDPAATHHPFGVWNYCTQAFTTKPGKYTVYVGNSADNTPHISELTVGS